MKAYLLAAGLGKRLCPLTRDVPECMASIEDRPLLRIWLKLMANHRVKDVLVSTRYLANRIQECEGNRSERYCCHSYNRTARN
ncbi:MAG: hypothetical protein LLG20_07930 [Acidobacteriales bacterium]|nr:hypothetical protein [Terriglobales bacterium]